MHGSRTQLDNQHLKCYFGHVRHYNTTYAIELVCAYNIECMFLIIFQFCKMVLKTQSECQKVAEDLVEKKLNKQQEQQAAGIL